MKKYHEIVFETVNMLENVDIQTHLIPIEHIPVIYHHLLVSERVTRFTKGYTNHPAFDYHPEMPHCYLLKPNQSASKALKELLTSYQMVIDCSTSIFIIHYISILNSMITIYGEEAGCHRFDQLFGSAIPNHVTPSHRRLKIIHLSTLVNLSVENSDIVVKDKWSLFQPLLMIFNQHEFANFEEFKSNLKLGSNVCFEGDRDNLKRSHPLSAHGGYNCIVTSIDPIRLRTFSCSKECSIADLRKMHIDAFKAPLSQEELFIIAEYKTGYPSGSVSVNPDINKIIGLKNSCSEISALVIDVLLKCPLEDACYILDIPLIYSEEGKGLTVDFANLSSIAQSACALFLYKLEDPQKYRRFKDMINDPQKYTSITPMSQISVNSNNPSNSISSNNSSTSKTSGTSLSSSVSDNSEIEMSQLSL